MPLIETLGRIEWYVDDPRIYQMLGRRLKSIQPQTELDGETELYDLLLTIQLDRPILLTEGELTQGLTYDGGIILQAWSLRSEHEGGNFVEDGIVVDAEGLADMVFSKELRSALREYSKLGAAWWIQCTIEDEGHQMELMIKSHKKPIQDPEGFLAEFAAQFNQWLQQARDAGDQKDSSTA